MVYKIVLPVFLLLALALSGIEYFAMSNSSKAIEGVAKRELYGIAATNGEKVLAYIAKGQNQAEGLAEGLAGLKAGDKSIGRSETIAMFKGFLASNPEYVGCGVAWEPNAFDGRDSEFAGTEFHDKSGRFIPYVYRSGGAIDVEALTGYDDPASGEFYFGPKKSGKTLITDPYKYKVGGKDVSMVSICAPILVKGKFQGVFALDLPISNIMEQVAQIKPYGTGYAWLMTPSGEFMYHPQKDLVGKNIFDVVKYEDESGIRRAINGGHDYYEVRKSAATGDVSMVQYVPIKFPGTGQYWILAVTAPIDKVLASSYSLSKNLMLMGSLALILVLVAIYFIARSISKPIGILTGVATEVAEGNFNVRVDGAQFGGELKELHTALMAMLNGLVENISKAEKMAEEAQDQTDKAQVALKEADAARAEAENAKREGMLQAAERLSGIVAQVSSASQELTAQIEESSRGSETQRERTAESATAMEQMNASVLEVARNAGQAAESADKAKGEAENGGGIVSDVVSRINRVQEMTVEMEAGLGELGKQAEGIGQIMNVITDIADQTNLLALNAAIEAARAGEAGRGFAVVADEVRKLAEKTMDATGQVGDFIKGIQQGTRDNIDGMSRAAAEVEQSTEFANKAGEALGSIVGIVEETAEQVRSIATASEEQSAASEQINRSIEEVNLIANDNAQAMRESTAAVEELMRLGEQLTGLIEELRNS